MRCLMLAGDDLLRPDEGMTDELRGLSAAPNRAGNNVNQVARHLNEAKLKGERQPYHRQRPVQEPSEMDRSGSLTDTVARCSCRHLMSDSKRSIPEICAELGGIRPSTLYHYLHADGTLKSAGQKLIGTVTEAGPAG